MLSTRDRKQLRARAHALKPVVIVGSAGVSAAVLSETDRALDHHELVKLRFLNGERRERADACERICEALSAAHIASVGRNAVIYRRRPDEERDEKGPQR